jgi:hypothetical protein
MQMALEEAVRWVLQAVLEHSPEFLGLAEQT